MPNEAEGEGLIHLDPKRTLQLSESFWNERILPALAAYIRIPNRSPLFDQGWKAAGHMDRAIKLVSEWAAAQELSGQFTIRVIEVPGRTPLIVMERPAQGYSPPPGTIVIYGHLDKQPESEGWLEGLSPWEPVRQGDRLYGRGSADDGYASFAAVTALKILNVQSVPHARCLIIIECGEESGSPDLPAYMNELLPELGTPDAVICLDSGCRTYDRLWITTSLRGVIGGDLRVDTLKNGVHSGQATCIVPSSRLIAMSLIARIADLETGQVKLDGLFTEIPHGVMDAAVKTAAIVGSQVIDEFAWVPGAQPIRKDLSALLIGNAWLPGLEITGVDGIPSLPNALNAMGSFTTFKLSMRIPPGVDPTRANEIMKNALETNPPFGAQVSYTPEKNSPGWKTRPLAPWLSGSINLASQTYFGQPAATMGEGGTIPLMKLLDDLFPNSQLLVTGVLGPESNAHGPNEFLDIPMAQRLTAAIAQIIADHARSHG